MKKPIKQDVIDVRVETGVLQPVYRRRVKFPALYSMKVGESFMILDDERSSLMQAAQHCRRITNPKRKFSVRRVAYNAFRVWRVE
jgi:uncharacterized protein (DUF2249 family)